MSNIGIIIFAVGASTRLGQPKQILAYQGKAKEILLQLAFYAESDHHW